MVAVALALAVAGGLVLAMLVVPRGDEPDPGSGVPVLVTTQTIDSPARSEVPYDVKDVIAAFRSGGVQLVVSSERRWNCPNEPFVPLPGVKWGTDGTACLRYVLRNGKFVRDTRKHAPEFPHVIAWDTSLTMPRGWTILIYGTADYAKGDAGDWESRTETSPVIGDPVRYERAENVVVAYGSASDAERIRELLDRL